MSHNIEHVDVLSGQLYITPEDAQSALNELDWKPELCFLEEIDTQTEVLITIPMDRFWWCDTASGNTFSDFLEIVVPKLKGQADIVFMWEDGSQEGYRIQDGTYKEMNVKRLLEES